MDSWVDRIAKELMRHAPPEDPCPSREFAPGVSVQIFDWGRIFKGTRDALIGAGLAAPDWFPGEPGQFKTIGYRRPGDNSCFVSRTSKNRFELRLRFTESELQARRERFELDQAQQQERRELAALPASHAEYRKRVEGSFLEYMRFFELSALVDGNSGYRYAPEAVQAFHEGVAELLQVLRESRTLFDARQRERYISGVRARTAKADVALQGFLENVVKEPTNMRGVHHG
jgi:hypothetical protein